MFRERCGSVCAVAKLIVSSGESEVRDSDPGV